MAIFSGPEILNDGLVLHLDSANERSYPGSGNTWYDLSGNENHVTLYNSPSFTNGIFSFDGTNQYARTINNINFSAYSSVTFEVTFRNTPGTVGMLMEHTTNWNTQTGGFGIATNTNGTKFAANICHSNHRPASSTWGRNNISISNENVWMTQSSIFSSIVDANGRYVIENGEVKSFTSSPYSSSTATNTTTVFTNAILYIGSRAGTGTFYNGDVSSIKVYGKKITLNEHTQNFEATRGRYAI